MQPVFAAGLVSSPRLLRGRESVAQSNEEFKLVFVT